MPICDKCKKTIREIGPRCLYGCKVTNGHCSPGYGSRYDSLSEGFNMDLPDGYYCYKCIDLELDNDRLNE